MLRNWNQMAGKYCWESLISPTFILLSDIFLIWWFKGSWVFYLCISQFDRQSGEQFCRNQSVPGRWGKWYCFMTSLYFTVSRISEGKRENGLFHFLRHGLSCPDCLWTFHVAQAVLKLWAILLPQSPGCWGCRESHHNWLRLLNRHFLIPFFTYSGFLPD